MGKDGVRKSKDGVRKCYVGPSGVLQWDRPGPQGFFQLRPGEVGSGSSQSAFQKAETRRFNAKESRLNNLRDDNIFESVGNKLKKDGLGPFSKYAKNRAVFRENTKRIIQEAKAEMGKQWDALNLRRYVQKLSTKPPTSVIDCCSQLIEFQKEKIESLQADLDERLDTKPDRTELDSDDSTVNPYSGKAFQNPYSGKAFQNPLSGISEDSSERRRLANAPDQHHMRGDACATGTCVTAFDLGALLLIIMILLWVFKPRFSSKSRRDSYRTSADGINFEAMEADP